MDEWIRQFDFLESVASWTSNKDSLIPIYLLRESVIERTFITCLPLKLKDYKKAFNIIANFKIPEKP